MIFTKYPSPVNFAFAEGEAGAVELSVGARRVELDLRGYSGGLHRLRVRHGETWPGNLSLVALDAEGECESRLVWDGSRLVLRGEDGREVLRGVVGGSLGLNREQSVFQFEMEEGTRFFGMGEKSFGTLELSGRRTVFWNTDVWSDFHWTQWMEHPADPSYFTTPYVALRTPGGDWLGLLLGNPAPTFMSTPGREEDRAFVHWQATSPHLVLGSYDGEPELWVVEGRSLGDLTRKVNRLIGVTPTPPLWSLGYHQSRWGYVGREDLLELDRKFREAGIPCSGLWLDLDYMDGYRVFTLSPLAFAGESGVRETALELAKSGRRIVPILDPGVKQEGGYEVYESGRRAGVFCENREGGEYVGMVWPGHTVFPDFTMAGGRDWWAGYVRRFRESGFGACWVDMNDPSTGPINPYDMLFRRGTERHWSHRNQYGLGMQMATVAGFLAAAPDERPFLLSRSGFTGSSRYSAIWTGDNVSNDFHMKLSVTVSLGMGISGHVFTGSDVGGFGEDCSARRMERWVQASFLTPFMRNHATAGTRSQEPFAYPAKTRDLVGRFIRLRYQFLPYLYSLFAEHEETGDALMRPVFYEDWESGLERVDDQFLVGPWVMQAPILEEAGEARGVRLFGKSPWFDLSMGEWVKAGCYVVGVGREETPVYLRAGAVVPLAESVGLDGSVDLSRPVVLVACPEGWTGASEFDLVADDGMSFGYRRGERSVMRVRVVAKRGVVEIGTEILAGGFGAIEPVFVGTRRAGGYVVDGVKAKESAWRVTLTGRTIGLRRLSV